jgi:hypothetical protein
VVAEKPSGRGTGKHEADGADVLLLLLLLLLLVVLVVLA